MNSNDFSIWFLHSLAALCHREENASHHSQSKSHTHVHTKDNAELFVRNHDKYGKVPFEWLNPQPHVISVCILCINVDAELKERQTDHGYMFEIEQGACMNYVTSKRWSKRHVAHVFFFNTPVKIINTRPSIMRYMISLSLEVDGCSLLSLCGWWLVGWSGSFSSSGFFSGPWSIARGEEDESLTASIKFNSLIEVSNCNTEFN